MIPKRLPPRRKLPSTEQCCAAPVRSWVPLELVGEVPSDAETPAGMLYRNLRYSVIVRERGIIDPYGRLLQLTILNSDGSARRDWRDFQRIKNELVGPQSEAVELYPDEGRMCDQANLFHLWVFPDHRFPFGFNRRQTEPLPVQVGHVPQRATS